MPQASDELRDIMGSYYGERICDSGPSRYLLSKGWKENGVGFWIAPYAKLSEIPRQEWDSICFLVHEWDHALKYPKD